MTSGTFLYGSFPPTLLPGWSKQLSSAMPSCLDVSALGSAKISENLSQNKPIFFSVVYFRYFIAATERWLMLTEIVKPLSSRVAHRLQSSSCFRFFQNAKKLRFDLLYKCTEQHERLMHFIRTWVSAFFIWSMGTNVIIISFKPVYWCYHFSINNYLRFEISFGY